MPDIIDIWIHMKAILRSARQIVNSELASLNLTGAEGDIIFHLLSKSGGLSQENLAERLDIGKAAISRTVNSLDVKGYIHRERQADDSRTYCVTLTDTAKDASEKIEHAYKVVYETALQGIGESEFQRFDRLLGKVYKNLNS
ncbi:MAG: MarR family winged helix-turn-helix transcriptional regulator [Bacillota bacterium]|jgi:DNA-binding MarR family transcriptional regulator|nr:MarR family winged helix-turn-helix transcriptional regulator [Bacillota bacterium]HHT94809.1 winged helix-turn-helix transcriptional regulator [Clostridiaceae bacterium]